MITNTVARALQKQLDYFNHIWGLSCISVTKECYQSGFHESSSRSYFFSYISLFFQTPFYGNIPATQPYNQETLPPGKDV